MSRSFDRSGSALVMVLVPLLLIAIASASLMLLSASSSREQSAAIDTKRVFYLAEAGLHEAMVGLHQGRTGTVASEAEPAFFGEGLFWVEARDLGRGMVRLDSHARSRGAEAELSWIVQRVVFNFGAFGFFSGKDLKVKKGSLIDGFDSTLGTYEAQLAAGTTGDAGRLASNMPISIDGGSGAGEWTHVHGSAEPGLGSAVSTNAYATVSGTTDSILEFLLPPPVEPPAMVRRKKLQHAGGSVLVLPPGDYGYDDIIFKSGADVVLRGPATVVVEKLTLEKGASLTLDTSEGEIEIYALEGLELGDGARATTLDGLPARSRIFAGDTDASDGEIKLGKGAELRGAVYAPNATVTVGEQSEVFGTIVADELKLSERVRLHFDRALGRQEQLYPEHRSWRLVELGSGPRDPFIAMGLDRDALPTPGQAHEDVWLEIKYRPSPGASKVDWEGWYHDFDWSLVFELHHYLLYDEPGGTKLVHVHP